jgi:hypothetical protein
VPPHVLAAPDPLPVLESFGITTCPLALGTPPVRRGLRCHHVTHDSKPTSRYEGLRRHHVPHAIEPATQQRRAPESPRVSRLQTHPLRRKALMSPHVRGTRTTSRQGFGITMCPVAPEPPSGAGGLWGHHVPYGPQPLKHARAFPRRLTSGSSWPHQARGAGITLNAYKTSHT